MEYICLSQGKHRELKLKIASRADNEDASKASLINAHTATLTIFCLNGYAFMFELVGLERDYGQAGLPKPLNDLLHNETKAKFWWHMRSDEQMLERTYGKTIISLSNATENFDVQKQYDKPIFKMASTGLQKHFDHAFEEDGVFSQVQYLFPALAEAPYDMTLLTGIFRAPIEVSASCVLYGVVDALRVL